MPIPKEFSRRHLGPDQSVTSDGCREWGENGGIVAFDALFGF